MKLLILLMLAGNLLTVTPPQSIAAPDAVGVVAQMQSDGNTFVYAHSTLSGSLFYDLKKGNHVTAFYNDGSHRDYEVSLIGAYGAQNTDIAKGGGDFNLRVDSAWIPITGVMAMYAAPGAIVLTTCYAADKGKGQVTGRMFIRLMPVEDKR